MATIRVKEWVHKDVNETCAYNCFHNCQEQGTNLMMFTPKGEFRNPIFVLVCDEHYHRYRQQEWIRVKEKDVNFVRSKL